MSDNKDNIEDNKGSEEVPDVALDIVFKLPFIEKETTDIKMPTILLSEYLPFKDRKALVDSIANSEDMLLDAKKEQLHMVRGYYTLQSTSNFGSTCLDGPERGFSQRPEIAGHKADCGISDFNVTGKRKLTGLKAVQAINSSLGYGSRNKVNLWHSGISLEIGNFKPLEFLQLIISLNEKRLELGYKTLGSIFTAEDSIITALLVDYILDHLVTCNLENSSKANIVDHMRPGDSSLLINAMMGSIYSNGYPLLTECSNVLTGKCTSKNTADLYDAETSKFSIDKLLDFNNLQWTDVNAFNLDDILIINGASGSVKNSDLEAYAKRHNQERIITTIEDNGTSYTLYGSQPNLTTSFEEGAAWVKSVEERVAVLSNAWTGSSVDERRLKRGRELDRFTRLLSAQRNASWINRIVVTYEGDSETEIIINDRAEINESLELQIFIDNAKVMEAAMAEFKDSFISSLIASTNWKCAVCHSGQTEKGSKYPSLIPLNIIQYFFSIGEWMLSTTE